MATIAEILYEEKISLRNSEKQAHERRNKKRWQREQKNWKDNIKNHKDLTKIYLILCCTTVHRDFRSSYTVKSFNASSHFMDEQNRE